VVVVAVDILVHQQVDQEKLEDQAVQAQVELVVQQVILLLLVQLKELQVETEYRHHNIKLVVEVEQQIQEIMEVQVEVQQEMVEPELLVKLQEVL
tara:strand:- start:267 stop:551 length:285 start_codon:yes stop_codon:yes gene_type:complete